LILNGRPFIDVEDWKHNTRYQGKYSAKHKTIKAFWKAMFSLTQEELSLFLQFSTGSQRVPIGGFEALQSNRGEVAKFCITPLNFDSKVKNFIRAHTCFNRIDLPMFSTEEQIKECILYTINNTTGFGID
jgi:E3 ubiquitin-protein ligase HUWE1